MANLKKINDLSLIDKKYLTYAVGRTGVALPNCFTYATANISQKVGYNQSLDDVRVDGAGDLWEKHHPNFKTSSTPCIGALMIWKGGKVWVPALRRYVPLGHVAVVEYIGSNGTVYWSQSNFGGKLFEYLNGDPKTKYKGIDLEFKGYLIHKDIKKEVMNKVPSGAKKVNTTFTLTSDKLTIYHAPSYNAKSTGLYYEKGNSVVLDYTYSHQGILWGSWLSKSTKTRRWMKLGKCNSAGALTKPYGKFK